MVFSSAIFLFLFLPCVLLGYYLIRFDLRNAFLLFVSLCFYFWGENFRVWIMIVSILMNYIFALGIDRIRQDFELNLVSVVYINLRKVVLWGALVANIGLLGYFKYTNFFVSEVLLHSGFTQIALPLGISFFTFQSMSYVIDVYYGNVRSTLNLIDFGCYVSSFPQLVAGPIVRYQDIVEQLKSRKSSFKQFLSGLERFILGLGKKVLIANTVANSADVIFALPSSELTPLLAWGGALCYTIQIYFDFSGYTDMAIGLGRMFGFEFCENFNYPYVSNSIQEFWRRWHMSLSSWFRDYLYIPLGGNRVSSWRVNLNLWIVFVLCGFWHGASWNFIIWGGFHGFFLSLERGFLGRWLRQSSEIIGHVYAIIVVVVGWIIFRCEDLTHIVKFLSSCIALSNANAVYGYLYYFPLDVQLALIVGILFSIPMKISSFFPLAWNIMTPLRYLGLLVMLILSSASVVSGNYNPFLYFRF